MFGKFKVVTAAVAYIEALVAAAMAVGLPRPEHDEIFACAPTGCAAANVDGVTIHSGCLAGDGVTIHSGCLGIRHSPM